MGWVKENVMGERTSGFATRNLIFMLLAMSATIVVLVPALSREQASRGRVEKASPRDAAEVSGPKLFHYYCASCHGPDGKGHGPAAASLKTEPIDLTLLAQRNGGKFPTDHVLYVLSNEGQQSVHGSKEMPVWGPIFRKTGGGDESMGRLRSHNLTDYLKSIQAK
jgi:mono/diheme cytochrome c family protein